MIRQSRIDERLVAWAVLDPDFDEDSGFLDLVRSSIEAEGSYPRGIDVLPSSDDRAPIQRAHTRAYTQPAVAALDAAEKAAKNDAEKAEHQTRIAAWFAWKALWQTEYFAAARRGNDRTKAALYQIRKSLPLSDLDTGVSTLSVNDLPDVRAIARDAYGSADDDTGRVSIATV